MISIYLGGSLFIKKVGQNLTKKGDKKIRKIDT